MLVLNVIDMCFSLLTVREHPLADHRAPSAEDRRGAQIGPTTAIRFSSLVADFVEPYVAALLTPIPIEVSPPP